MIKLGSDHLSINDLYKIIFKGEQIEIGDDALSKVKKSFSFLKKFSKDKVIYGINTGFGPMAQYKISDHHQVALQYNLIRSHCSGSGHMIAPVYVKSLMVARLNTLLLGYSGVSPETVEILVKLINSDITPVVYEHGSVGASGDLVQLAHVALGMIGEGEVHYKGQIHSADKLLAEHGIAPLAISLREGLAIMNGTSSMTGIGMINIIHAKNLVSWSIVCSTMINEIVESYDDHFSAELNGVKLHEGQNMVAGIMRDISKGSKLIRKRADHLYNKKLQEGFLNDKVQEYYSLRCVPQVLGPVLDTILHAEKVLTREVNSVNDNPVIDPETENVYHGGNFHGDYIALEMDKLKIAVTKLSMLAERQLNYLLNHKLNNILPPFVNLGVLGLNFGMQGVQFTATSTVAENQTLAFPMYVHSIPNNNDNQDIVSMGTNASLLAKKTIDNTYEVLSIELMAVIQAIDYLNNEERLSQYSGAIFKKLRKIVPKFEDDSIKYKDIRNIKEFILSENLNIIS
jgi:histidine ammonia-lyase